MSACRPIDSVSTLPIIDVNGVGFGGHYIRTICADLRRGWLFVVEGSLGQGRLLRVRFVSPELLYQEMRKIPCLGAFPPGLVPIICSFANDTGMLEEMKILGRSVDQISVDGHSGEVVTWSENKLRRWTLDGHGVWAKLSVLPPDVPLLTSDGRFTYFSRPGSVGRVERDGSVSICVHLPRDLQPASYRPSFLAVDWPTVYLKQETTDKLITFQLPRRPDDPFSSRVIECCDKFASSVCYSHRSRILFILHSTHICALHPEATDRAARIASVCDFVPPNRMTFADNDDPDHDIAGYIFVAFWLAGAYTALHCISVSRKTVSSVSPSSLPATKRMRTSVL